MSARLHILSDLHTEFGPFPVPETDADVVVLAGDIGLGCDGVHLGASLGRPVVYVAGNHEYYRHEMPRLDEELATAAAGTAVRVLHDSEAVVAGVRFLGCTLWTSFSLYASAFPPSEAMEAARLAMSDYSLIRYAHGRRLSPVDTLHMHIESVAWLCERLASPHPGPTVVVTHHAPAHGSVPERDRLDVITCAFASDLEHLMRRGGVDLWIHGHTHHCVDYTVGGTRVVSNQRGYPDEARPGFRPDLVVKVG